ncbi:MAG: hypothetical protein Q7R96_01935 [Nanoarchaeota archaeon]|nr:hypothetical protein [Nanoarchaeota archaeon]
MIITPDLRVQAAGGMLACCDHFSFKTWESVHGHIGVKEVYGVGVVKIEHHFFGRDVIKMSYNFGDVSVLEVLCGPDRLGVNVLSFDRLAGYVVNGHDRQGNSLQYRSLPHNDFVRLRRELEILRDYKAIL